MSSNPLKNDPATLLTVAEVMDYLKVSRRSVFYYADKGLIQRIKIGDRVVRYSLGNVDALIPKLELPPHRKRWKPNKPRAVREKSDGFIEIDCTSKQLVAK